MKELFWAGLAYLAVLYVCLLLFVHLLKNIARAITYGVTLGLRNTQAARWKELLR